MFRSIINYFETWQDYHWLLALYTLITIIIAVVGSRKRTTEDFLIAGRKVGTLGFTTSVVASYIGGAALVAFSAYVFRFGLSALFVFLGTAVGFILFIPYAKKLKSWSDEKVTYTMMDWFYIKYDKKTGTLTTIVLMIVYLGMLLNQFIAGSAVLAGVSGWTYEKSLIFAAVVLAVYLFIGGFQSVIRTDIFQYFVMMVIMIVIIRIIWMNDAPTVLPEMYKTTQLDWGMMIAFLLFGILIVFQSAEYWQRVYAAKSIKVVKKGFWWSAVLTFISGIIITWIALSAKISNPNIEPTNAFGTGLVALLPQKLSALVLVMVFAAIMSSADTQIFVISSGFALNLFKKAKDDDKKLKKNTQFITLIVILLAVLIAYFIRDIVTVVNFITGIGFTVLPVAWAAFHFNISPKIAFQSVIAGLVYVLLLIIFGIFIPEFVILSFIVSGLYMFVGNRIVKKKEIKKNNIYEA